jgi:hypothetical protein
LARNIHIPFRRLTTSVIRNSRGDGLKWEKGESRKLRAEAIEAEEEAVAGLVIDKGLSA